MVSLVYFGIYLVYCSGFTSFLFILMFNVGIVKYMGKFKIKYTWVNKCKLDLVTCICCFNFSLQQLIKIRKIIMTFVCLGIYQSVRVFFPFIFLNSFYKEFRDKLVQNLTTVKIPLLYFSNNFVYS